MTIKIKPLEWQPESALGFFRAFTPFGHYAVCPSLDSKKPGYTWWFDSHEDHWHVLSLAKAKDACEAHWQLTVRSVAENEDYLPFNINNHIRVKLNEFGLTVLKGNHDELRLKRPFEMPKVDEEGYTQFQFWYFAQQFGFYLHMGGQMPFDATILINTRAP